MFSQKKELKEKENLSVSEAKVDDVLIYAMPEQFRLNSRGVAASKKTGLLIMLGGTLFFVALAGAAYYYFFMGEPKKTQTPPADNQSQTATTTKKQEEVKKEPVAVPVVKTKTPKETYLEIKQKTSTLASSIPQFAEIGEITEEIQDSESAILKAKTKDLKKEGMIVMSLSGGAWRVASEEWKDVAPAKEELIIPAAAEFKAGRDGDNDGLTDKEEVLLGLLSGSTDSDSDGFSDYMEMMNLYDPAGSGQLKDNANVGRYRNKTFAYEALYPAKWEILGSDDESIVIKSSDNQFFQIIVQPNPNKQDIGSWYEQQIGESGSKSVAGLNWSGMESKNGLILYLTDNRANYIFTLAYNPGESDTLDYINLFKLLAKSLIIE